MSDPDSHVDPDLCIDLLSGLVAEPERRAALAHVATCPACEDRLRRQAGLRERLRSRSAAALRERAAEPAAEEAATLGRPVAGWRARLRRLLGALAPVPLGPRLAVAGALAALVVVALLPRSAHRVSELPAIHPLPAEAAHVITRDPAATLPDSLVRAGLEAYARGDLAGARRLLAAARAGGRMELVREVFLASTLALRGDHRGAAELLERVPLDQVPDPWRSESRWTLMVALRARGDERRAVALLEALAAEPGPVGDRARAMLGRR